MITQCRASIDRIFYNFSVTRIVRMICAKKYESYLNLSKLRPKYCRFPFSGHGVYDKYNSDNKLIGLIKKLKIRSDVTHYNINLSVMVAHVAVHFHSVVVGPVKAV